MEAIESFAKYRVTVLSPGRQFGKSSVRPFAIMDQMSRHSGWTVGAYVGPSHGDALKAFEEDLFNFGRVGLVKDSGGDDQDRHIDYFPIVRDYPIGHPTPCACEECLRCSEIKAKLKGRASEGCRVYYVSGHPDAHAQFQKHKLHFAIIDEFSHVAYEAWVQTIRPMFNTTGGHALIIGTPIEEGINFIGFRDTFFMGVTGDETYNPRYNAISGSSFDNPYANVDEILEQIADLEKAGRHASIRCWFYGEFATDSGAVFDHLDTTFTLDYHQTTHGWKHRDPKEGENVVIGLDFAESVKGDYAVASAFSIDTREQLEIIRLRGVLYEDQLPIYDELYRRMGPRTIVMADGKTAGGHVVNVMRQRYGNAIQTVKWARGGEWDKSTCVTHAQHLCQASIREDAISWKMMKVPEQMAEFRQYAKEAIPSGGWKYGAPKNKHDDLVCAALFASYRLELVERPKVEAPDRKANRRYDLTATPVGSQAWLELLHSTQHTDRSDATYTLH